MVFLDVFGTGARVAFPFLSLIRNDAQVVWCPKDQQKSIWRRKQLESGQKKGRSWMVMVDPQSFFHEITLSPKAAGFSVMESGSSFLCRDPETHRKSQLQLEVRPENTSLISSVTTSSQQGQNAAHHGGRRAASRTVHGRKTHPTNTVLGCDVALFCLYSVSPLRKPTKKKNTVEVRSFTLQIII